jgi:hypothetical protein
MEGRALLLELPWWMRSRVGQWLARNFPGGRRLWQNEMDAALERVAEFDQIFARDELLHKLNLWAATNFDEQHRVEIIGGWCQWRNTAERLHRAREQRAGRSLDVPLALVGLPMMDDDPAFLEFMGKAEPNG